LSILLESLNQQADENRNHQLPDIHSSHFDDEMLGDEVLYKKLKLWKIISLLLFLILLSSWGYFYFQMNHRGGDAPKKVLDETAVVEIKQAPENNNKKTNETQVESAKEEVGNTYKPQKREVKTVENTVSVQQEKTKTERSPKTIGAAVFVKELPTELQQKFPNIEINSYVIADKSEDSFVILDGSFYKTNQVITPDLTLRNITSENIIVEFHAYLVKIPLK